MEKAVLKPKKQKKLNGSQDQIIIETLSDMSTERISSIFQDITKNNSILKIFDDSKAFKSTLSDSYGLAGKLKANKV